jgi:hypothetical protein
MGAALASNMLILGALITMLVKLEDETARLELWSAVLTRSGWKQGPTSGPALTSSA